MKKLAVLIGLFVLGLSVAPAKADSIIGQPAGPDPFYFTFDENGNGSIQNWNGTSYDPAVPLLGALTADPTNGGIPALLYVLPDFVVEGDELVYDGSGLSDMLRFTDSTGNLSSTGNWMFFYSLPGGGDLADTGIPLSSSTFSTTEDAAGHFFLLFGDGSNNYEGISSPEVPEPMSLTLLGTGLLGLYRARRKNANNA